MDTKTRPIQPSPSSAVTLEQKSTEYRQIIIQVLTENINSPANGIIQTVPIFDRENDRYQLLDIGWDESGRRVFQPVIHVDIIDEKIWIQENTTDVDIAKEFMSEGVNSSDIILGFHSRSLRQFSEYGVE